MTEQERNDLICACEIAAEVYRKDAERYVNQFPLRRQFEDQAERAEQLIGKTGERGNRMTNHPNRGKRSRKVRDEMVRKGEMIGGYPKLTYRRGWTPEMEEPCKPVEAYNAQEAMKLLGIEDLQSLQVLENGSWIWVV